MKAMGAGRIVLFLLMVLLPRAATAGSPFYLTVERSYGGSEKPQVRLDYLQSSPPMRLRVLKPQQLERFLDGQFQISRSYEEPVTQLNPGHFVVKGLNAVESPLRSLRGMLSADFRRNFRDTAFSHAIRDTGAEELASVPEAVIHGPPAGFAVTREFTLDLEYGGSGQHDLGWWFADSAWREDRYRIRTVTLDPLPDGLYLLQAVQGKTEAQCLMQVSSLSMQVKQSSAQLLVRVITRDHEPVAGARVSFRDGRGQWRAVEGLTNELGEVLFRNPGGILEGRLLVRAETGDGRQALAETDFLPAVTADDAVFILTDRPIFKPGERFFYKGIVRSQERGRLRLPDPAAAEAKVILASAAAGGGSAPEALVPLTPFGSFSGSFQLEEDLPPGLHRLVAEIAGKPYGGEFRVRDYVKPSFYLELLERSPAVVPGRPFALRFQARRYSGGAPPGIRYEVFLYRKKFEVPPWVAEAGEGLSAGSDYHGEVRSTGALTEPRRVFSSVEARLAGQSESFAGNSWDSAPLAEQDGEARFEFTVPEIEGSQEEEWLYTVMVRAMDRAGALAVLTETITATRSEAHPVVRFSEPVAQVGRKDIALAMRATYPDGRPAPDAGGVVALSLEQGAAPPAPWVRLPFVTDARGMCTISLPELTQRGRLQAVATLETLSGRAMRQPALSPPALMIVGGAEGEAVLENRELELYTSGTLLSPGEKARVFALLPAGWGKGESGPIWETIAGREIFATVPSRFQGRSRWIEVEAKPEYGTGFYHTLTVPMGNGQYRERTLGFRIVPQDQRLRIDVQPERPEAEPLKPLRIDLTVLDSAGRPAPDTELAVGIVDRAVYAVQGELRPGILDFFYPLPRLNLATFSSDELQGYGYADLLKKPNFKLGALKSQSKLTKKALRDTAGFFPHVVTDAAGRASVTVDLPANVTEWSITAVAADKGGRVGEGQGRFRTSADLAVDLLAPQFMRFGERAEAVLKVASQRAEAVVVGIRTEATGGLTLAASSPDADREIPPHGEGLWPLSLEAPEGIAGTATLQVAVSAPPEVRVGGAEDFDIPLKPAAMTQRLAAERRPDGLLELRIPPQAGVRELAVQVHAGLLGAALQAAAVLAAYPYGCTEQLVHTTVPNLVLMDLVQKAGLGPQDLGPLAEVVTRARRHAALGIGRLRRNQKSDGGFGLWPSDPEASLEATVTAVYALKLARELEVEGAGQALSGGEQWLGARFQEDALQRGPLSGYLLARLAAIGGWSQPYEQVIDFVERVHAREGAATHELIDALRILAANATNNWSRVGIHFKKTTVQADLVRRLQRALGALGGSEPLRPAGRSAPPSFQEMGFTPGPAYLAAAGMGVLGDLKALPDPLARQLKRMLLLSLRNGYWSSTFDTAHVIFNSRHLIAAEAAQAVRDRDKGGRILRVLAGDGSVLGRLTRIPAGFAGRFDQPGPPERLAQIRIEGLEAEDVPYAFLEIDVPYAALEPSARGLTVERRLYRIVAEGSAPFDPAVPLGKGERVVSEVRVRRVPLTDQPAPPSEWIVVEDGIPSLAQGIEGEESLLADARLPIQQEDYWRAIRETRRYPDRTLRVVRVRPGHELRIHQVWQAGFAGHAALPPARAFDMYDESLRGNSGAGLIVVE